MCGYGNLEIQTKAGWHGFRSSEFSLFNFSRKKVVPEVCYF